MPVSVFTLLNPLLAWGVAAIAAPILIHLLLRQRPRPRPWAAMRWLLAAMQAAQRRYKLTNLLLLLLRCLALILLALALARPSLAGFGRGGRLVLVVDTTASMGATADGGGALAAVRQMVEEADLDHNEVALVTIDGRVQVRALGSAADIRSSVASLTASPIPGGLARATDDEVFDTLLEAASEDSDVILVSDFRQDDGQRLLEQLEERVRSVTRWRVGSDGTNAQVVGVSASEDLVPGLPGSIGLEIAGETDQAELAVDDGLPVPVELLRTGDLARLALPPLDAGRHVLRVTLQDRGLTYDDLLELSVLVRPTVPAAVVETRRSRMEAALQADSSRIEQQRHHPSDTAWPLPDDGLVVAREPLRDSARVAEWVREGGVLWTTLERLADDPALGDLPAEGFAVDETMLPGGPLATGQADLDASLERITVERLPTLTLPAGSEVLLAAGADPMVVALPAGRGWMVVEALAIEDVPALGNAGAFPLWIRRSVRDLTGRLHLPLQLQAGQPVPEELVLERDGRELALEAGERLMAEPGLWRQPEGEREVVVLPSRSEGRLQTVADAEVVRTLSAALPQGRGADWGLGLLIAALAVLLLEGSIAAWAGRAYGR